MYSARLLSILCGPILLLAGMGPVCSDTTDDAALQASIERCLEQVKGDGQRALQIACPDTWALLQDSDIATILTTGWSEEVDADSLSAVRRMVTDYQPRRPLGARFDRQRLQGIIAQMDLEQAQIRKDFLWKRFKLWLRELLGHEDGDSENTLWQWLNGLELSAQNARYLSNAVWWLVAVIALGVVIRELRLMRRSVLPDDAAAGGAPDAALSSQQVRRYRSLDEIGRLQAAAQPPALLCFTLERLAQAGVMVSDNSQTNGELTQRLAMAIPAAVPAFAGIRSAAEQVVFGDQLPDEQELALLRQQYVVLEAQLPGVQS